MDSATLEDQSPPSALLLALPAAILSAVAGFAWLFLALEAIFAAPWSNYWLWCGFALPGAAVGAVVTHSTRRWWPFFLGLAITLLPIVLYIVLPGPPSLVAGGD